MIKVNNLKKCYSDKPVISDISFTISENGVYGFLGPNGAGKSTTMNIITGCLAATEGTVEIGGHDIVEEPEEAKRLIGYLPEQPPLYMDMTPNEYLSFVAAARGVKKDEIKTQVARSMDLTGITPVRDRLIRHLSKGYKQRVGISETLLGDPRIIILDEPTGGLDPKQITEIRDLVRNLGKDHIILFSSHIMQEVQAISDHVMIIAKGRLLVSGRAEELERYLRKKPVLRIRTRTNRAAAEELLHSVTGIEEITFDGEEEGITAFHFTADDENGAAESVFLAFAGAKRSLISLEHESMTLEEAFLQLTSGLDTYAPDPQASSLKTPDPEEDEETAAVSGREEDGIHG